MALPKFVHTLATFVAGIPVVGTALRRLAGGRLRLRYYCKHPFDEAYGVDTSGRVEPEALTKDPNMADKIVRYTGIQPSVARRAFAALPETGLYTFVDLGCGKGRATILASEFSFDRIVGVELAPQLAAIARQNAAIIHTHYPERKPITIIEGNAIDLPVAARKIVLFLYNPFGGELIAELMKTIEKRLAKDVDHMFVIYHNPVCGDVFDRSPVLQRWYADHAEIDESEKNFGPEREGATVIWQSTRNAKPDRHPRRDRAIKKTGFMETGLAAVMGRN